jgi:hypothetical protein
MKMVVSANPGVGAGRISGDHAQAEQDAMSWRGWLVERCGIGAWPDTSGVAKAPISAEEWHDLEDRGSKIVGDIVLSFDVGRDPSAALMICGAGVPTYPAGETTRGVAGCEGEAGR